MHELGITRNIVAIVGDAAKGRRVRRVTLEIGKLSGVMSEAIAFCFEAVAQGTALEGARLEIRRDRGPRALQRLRRRNSPADDAVHACACGSRRLQRLQGEELKIKSMELEVEAA